MTRAADASGDALRAGLSYLEEARLLSALRLGMRDGDPWLGHALPALRALSDEPVRAAATDSLATDLLGSPLRPIRHPDWSLAERAGLPHGVREATTVRWLEAARPALSGRLRRSPRREPGHLALATSAWRRGVLNALTDRALTLLLHSLGGRERLTLLAALGSGSTSLRERDFPAAMSSQEILSRGALHCFRTGFGRAAARASRPEHLRARFAAFLLAVALGDRHAVELRALAEAVAAPEGERLLRYAERERNAWGPVPETALGLLDDALAQAPPLELAS